MADNEQFIPLVRKHTELAKAVLVFLVSIVIVVIAVVPIFESANNARKQLGRDRDTLEDLSNRVVVLQGIDDAILENRFGELNTILPNRKDIVAYLVTIDGLSRDLELELGSVSIVPGDVTESTQSAENRVSPVANARSSGLSSIETDITIQGEEDKIYEFIRSIENVVPLMQIKDVGVSRDESVFNLTMRLGMLYSEEGPLADAKGVVSLFTPEEERLYNQLQGFTRYRLEDLPVSGSSEGVGIENLFTPLELRLSGSLQNLQPEVEESPQSTGSSLQ